MPTPDAAVLHPHSDIDAVILGAALGQVLLQGHGVKHETVVEAPRNVVHLGGETRMLRGFHFGQCITLANNA